MPAKTCILELAWPPIKHHSRSSTSSLVSPSEYRIVGWLASSRLERVGSDIFARTEWIDLLPALKNRVNCMKPPPRTHTEQTKSESGLLTLSQTSLKKTNLSTLRLISISSKCILSARKPSQKTYSQSNARSKWVSKFREEVSADLLAVFTSLISMPTVDRFDFCPCSLHVITRAGGNFRTLQPYLPAAMARAQSASIYLATAPTTTNIIRLGLAQDAARAATIP